MFFEKIFLKLIQEQRSLGTPKTKPLVDAVKNRHPITFYYNGPQSPEKDRVLRGYRVEGEPVAIGLSKKGNLIVRVYVPSPNVSKKGFNKTHWRTFMVSRMSDLKVLNDKTFDNKREDYKDGSDDSMTVTYVTSNWTSQQQPTPEPQPERPTTEPTPQEPTQQPTPEPQQTTEPETQELPQPKPDVKPDSTPDVADKNLGLSVYNLLKTNTNDVNGQKSITTQDFQNAVRNLYDSKRREWINKQKQIPGANPNPGQGTRARMERESENELKDLLSKDNIQIVDQNLQESLYRIKTLMFS